MKLPFGLGPRIEVFEGIMPGVRRFQGKKGPQSTQSNVDCCSPFCAALSSTFLVRLAQAFFLGSYSYLVPSRLILDC